MTAEDVLDDAFHWAAWRAFMREAEAVQGWPDPERVRQTAYRLYEAELASKHP